MSRTDDDLIARLEAMPLEQARTAIHHRRLGCDFDSPNHRLCLSWLTAKDDAARAAREEASLSISREALANSEQARRVAVKANIIAIIAMILATVAGVLPLVISVMHSSPK
ncbi:MAG: hypothetical protein AW10_01679 [Candidatus Accumulibacter appositus]|jgi:hypothetical protein|uniref:Transmembrane protein n=1 Tax=Candidatus Accumulibacter appositus TaxID=1454003 RepID=A0A011PUN2_9PROT|nr:hypothetical protein [Accumulibacter sp.]EXI80772.1 MAG: hypothetical protein AW10_01679 [Candidatus Accumulibacter appositus]HRF06210.1 hypothetical protein [Accumulibacter sp.]